MSDNTTALNPFKITKDLKDCIIVFDHRMFGITPLNTFSVMYLHRLVLLLFPVILGQKCHKNNKSDPKIQGVWWEEKNPN